MTALDRFSPPPARGSRAPSRRRPRRRRAPGTPSPPAATPSSSRPPAAARPCRRSCGRSTGWPRPPSPRSRGTAAGSLRQPAQGARGRRRAQPARAADRHPAGLAAAGPAGPRHRVGIRSGDTPADERRRFNKVPPDVFITTPESLFLLLTSQRARGCAGRDGHRRRDPRRVRHQARRPPRADVERLDELLERPAQRIGLSATVRPIDEVARFLGGTREVVVVQPPSPRRSRCRSSSRSRT